MKQINALQIPQNTQPNNIQDPINEGNEDEFLQDEWNKDWDEEIEAANFQNNPPNTIPT